MVIAIIVQARMASTRLPGKVLKKIFGKTLLEHLISRLKKVKSADKIIVATTTKQRDGKIVKAAKKLGVDFFRGSEEDVLDRTYQAAKIRRLADGDAIVRVTSDCPIIDPAIVDKVINFYKRNKNKFDYVSNTYPPTFPDGMDTEVFSFKALERAWKNASLLSEREHVTAYIYKHTEIFRIGNVRSTKDNSHLRLTVDEPNDLILVRKIFGALYKKNKYFTLRDILSFLKRNPKSISINQHIKRNEGYLTSLKEDAKFLKEAQVK